MKQERNWLILGLIVLMIVMGVWVWLSGCATTQQTGVSGAYIARKTLNDYWESYLDLRDTMTGIQKEKLMYQFEDTGKNSIFTEATKYLDLWDTAIGTASELQAQKSYQALLNKIIILLFEQGVIELEVQ